MLLPVRTAPEDIEAICGYLLAKPDGVSPAEVINQKTLDGRKLSALRFWGLIEDTSGKLKLSERGVRVAAERGAHRAKALRDILVATPPYGSVIARAVHRNEMIILSSEIAAHWQRHFRAYLHVHSGVLNHQIVCFLRIAEGANLGRLVVGRKGKETRFEISEDDARDLLNGASIATWQTNAEAESTGDVETQDEKDNRKFKTTSRRSHRVFITHRNNGKVLEQVKELVAFGRFEPVVARERDAAAGPLLYNLMEQMRGCDTAVIHVAAHGPSADDDRHPWISGDVLIEIGAAMALYGRNFVLLIEDAVELPPSLHGLCECRYSGDELNMPAMMRLLRTFSAFTPSLTVRQLPDFGADSAIGHARQSDEAAAPVQQ